MNDPTQRHERCTCGKDDSITCIIHPNTCPQASEAQGETVEIFSLDGRDYVFTIRKDYQPGHISEFYGAPGGTGIATLHPLAPNDGDVAAMFGVGGDWDFDISRLDADGNEIEAENDPIAGCYRKPEDLRPEIEAIRKAHGDGDTFEHQGHKYSLSVRYNNWFVVEIGDYHRTDAERPEFADTFEVRPDDFVGEYEEGPSIPQVKEYLIEALRLAETEAA